NGLLTRTLRPDGTISSTVYDGLGRRVTELLGNDDSNTSSNNMVVQAQYHYDHDGIGDSLLTSSSDALGRTTTYQYDFRGRATGTTLPDPDGDPGTTDAEAYSTAYDNLDRILSTTDNSGTTYYQYFDTAPPSVQITQPDGGVTVQAYNA